MSLKFTHGEEKYAQNIDQATGVGTITERQWTSPVNFQNLVRIFCTVVNFSVRKRTYMTLTPVVFLSG